MPFCFSEGLGEAYDGDIAFASSLETFGGGHNDPISVAFGGWSCYFLSLLFPAAFIILSCMYAAGFFIIFVLLNYSCYHVLVHENNNVQFFSILLILLVAFIF
jgi:hypothetical protein